MATVLRFPKRGKFSPCVLCGGYHKSATSSLCDVCRLWNDALQLQQAASQAFAALRKHGAKRRHD